MVPGAVIRPERVFTSEKAFEKPPPFTLMAPGMYYRPHLVVHFWIWGILGVDPQRRRPAVNR